MKKSQIISLISAIVLIAATIILIAIAAPACAGSPDAIHPMVYVMMIFAVAAPFISRPIIIAIEKMEEEGK